MNRRITWLAAILALASGGCGHVRKQFVLPAVPGTAVQKPLPEAKIETPPEIEAPMPRVDIPWPKMSPAEDPSAHQAEQKKKPQPATPTVQTLPPETQPANPIAPSVPAPRLGEMLTDNRRREYEAEFTGSMTRARTAVNRASGRRLTAAQKETVARIGVFLQQADKSRVRDLMQALQLARRADLLGQDLLKSLR